MPHACRSFLVQLNCCRALTTAQTSLGTSLTALLPPLLLLLSGHQPGLAAGSALGPWLPAGHRHTTIHTRGALIAKGSHAKGMRARRLTLLFFKEYH
jgi:hypothetical protein